MKEELDKKLVKAFPLLCWKYGLIKVAIEDEGADYEVQINRLVELYPLGDNGEYNSFCRARLQSIEEIQNAQKDIEHDGINEWFYDNGVFEWKVCNNCAHGDWDWIRSIDDDNEQNNDQN